MDNFLKVFIESLWLAFEHPFSPWFCLLLFMLVVTISDFLKKRREANARLLRPWFPSNDARQIYHTLVILQIQRLQELAESNPERDLDEEMGKAQFIHNAALLKWAVEALRRALIIKDQNDACKQLAAQGSIGEDMARWAANTEKACQEDLNRVLKLARATTCDEFADRIMLYAFNVMDREDLDKKLAAIEEKREEEKALWEARRQSIIRELVKELGEEDLLAQSGSGDNGHEGNAQRAKNKKRRERKGKAKGKN